MRFILFITLAILLAGCTSPQIEGGLRQWPTGQTLTDSQGQVVVKVTPVESNDRDLHFEISLETHSVELSMDLEQVTTLTTNQGLTVRPIHWDGMQGGHHVSGQLVYSSSANGSSLLSNANQITLIMRGVDAPERAFTWTLD